MDQSLDEIIGENRTVSSSQAYSTPARSTNTSSPSNVPEAAEVAAVVAVAGMEETVVAQLRLHA